MNAKGHPYNCHFCAQVAKNVAYKRLYPRTSLKPEDAEPQAFNMRSWRLFKITQNVIILRYMSYVSGDTYTPGHTQRFNCCPTHYETFKAHVEKYEASLAWKDLMGAG